MRVWVPGTAPSAAAAAVLNCAAGLHADLFNWRDMYFGPKKWAPLDPSTKGQPYMPEYDCHNPRSHLYNPTAEITGEVLAGAPFENAEYSRQLSVWYIPLTLSGQTWDARSRQLRFAPAITPHQCPPDTGNAVEEAPAYYVLPFFVAGASGHLLVSHCRPFSAAFALHVIAGDMSVAVDVSVVDPRSGRHLATARNVFLHTGEKLSLSHPSSLPV